jgi:hypothetical protein
MEFIFFDRLLYVVRSETRSYRCFGPPLGSTDRTECLGNLKVFQHAGRIERKLPLRRCQILCDVEHSFALPGPLCALDFSDSNLSSLIYSALCLLHLPQGRWCRWERQSRCPCRHIEDRRQGTYQVSFRYEFLMTIYFLFVVSTRLSWTGTRQNSAPRPPRGTFAPNVLRCFGCMTKPGLLRTQLRFVTLIHALLGPNCSTRLPQPLTRLSWWIPTPWYVFLSTTRSLGGLYYFRQGLCQERL